MGLPLSNYASASYDMVLRDDELVRFSMFAGYSFDRHSLLGTAHRRWRRRRADPRVGRGGRRDVEATVERHRQTGIESGSVPPVLKDAGRPTGEVAQGQSS